MSQLEAYLHAQQIDDIHQLHPSDIAKFLKDLDDDSFDETIKEIPKDLLGEVALELPDRYFEDVVDSFSPKDLADAVSELESDDQTDFIQELEEIDDKVAQEVFDNLKKDDQEDILKLKQYSDNEAGAYMQTEVYSANLEQNVHHVIKEFAKLRRNNELENVQNLFVSDHTGKLRYGIGLDHLLIFNFEKTLKENIEESPEDYKPTCATDHTPIDEIVHMFQEYNLSVLPIVDNNNTLLGRITSDDIYDIMDEQATHQMYQLAGVNDEAEEENLLTAGKARAVWLGVNLITAILASLVIGLFETTLHSMIALAVLMPIVASMGGNAGTQSLTVVVRQLALGDIAKYDAFRTIKKEVLLSLINGLLFAILMGLVAYLWFNMWLLGIVIALSMVINLLSAGLFGSMVPLLLQKLGIDPAVASTVVLTTITDVVGFFSFLGLATLILL